MTRGWVLGAGAVLVLLVYGPRINSPLIWDDRGLIAFNPVLSHPIPLRDYVTQRYFELSNEYSWRPLSTLSYRAIIRLSGRSPAALRGVSLLFHLLNGLLLYAILIRWRWPAEAAAWGVALFWLHPVQVESLMCAAFNKEPLAAFGLLAMLAAHQRRRWWLAGIGLTWSLLAKETGLAGLPLVMLYDLSDGGPQRLRERAGPYLYYATILAAYLWARFFFLSGPAQALAVHIPLAERVFDTLGGWILAVRLFIAPVGLRIEYFALPAESGLQWAWRIAAGGGLAAIVLFGARWAWSTDRKLAFFWIWPLPFILMTSGLVTAGALNTRLMADRWLYLPALGWSVITASLLTRTLKRRAALPMAMLAAAFSLIGFARASDWSNEISLWRGLERFYPWSAKAAAGLGEAYARAGQWTQALPEFEKAFQLREGHSDKVLEYYVPLSHGLLRWEDPSLFRWLGQAEAQRGELKRAEGYFRRSVELDPNDGYSFAAMALYLAQAKEYGRARTWVEQGLERHPGDDLLLRIQEKLPR